MKAPLYVLAGLLAITACAHEKAAVAAAPPAPVVPPAVAKAPAPAPVAEAKPMTCASDAQCSSTQLCVRSTCTGITAALEECGTSRVHFDLDKADLRDDARPVLDRAARCINADPSTKVLVTGNADERGAVEYNLGLGERRAQAVQGYLTAHGVASTQLSIVSYGKELPLCSEHDEACWARNRRASVEPNGRPKDIARIIQRDERAERRGPKMASASRTDTSKTEKRPMEHRNTQGRRP